jgi:hypothetical protein
MFFFLRVTPFSNFKILFCRHLYHFWAVENRMKTHILSLLFCLLLIFPLLGQEIKTKVVESGFDVKPDAQKEVELDEARTFVFLGAGFGRRQGNVLNGYELKAPAPVNQVYKTTSYAEPFRNGINIELGFRHFLESNFGFGIRGNFWQNRTDYEEISNEPKPANDPADSRSSIYYGTLEALYRKYLGSSKTSFVYGSLGLGWAVHDNEQNYRYGRKNASTEGYFMVRPAVGINLPIWERLHGHFEAGYNFSQGSNKFGDVSLSQWQISIGTHFRINPF